MEPSELKDRILEFLKANVVAVVATTTVAHTPSATTIYYIVEDDFSIYFMTKSSSRKAGNIANNNHIALVVGTDNIPITVQVEGIAQEVHGKDEVIAVVGKLASASNQGEYFAPIDNLPGDKMSVYKVTPSWMRLLDFRKPHVYINESISLAQ